MRKNRMILLAQGLTALGISLLMAFEANASVTKVGNGDDGADLESLTVIKSGPIFKSRLQALRLLNKLNVVGVPGLGLLMSEIERTELLMAAHDVHPTGEKQGSFEISEDQKFVYARTFAEPNAATRFFPIAQKLKPEQLVALQIHEALHRSLPSEIRGDENIVMHYTLAITSPGASFDRILQVSELYNRVPSREMASTENVVLSHVEPTSKIILPPSSSTVLNYEFNSYSGNRWGGGGDDSVQGIGLMTSIFGYRNIMGFATEPVFKGRLQFASRGDQGLKLGASSFELEMRTRVDDSKLIGPFVRFTTKEIDYKKYENQFDSVNYISDGGGRDILTLGGIYRAKNDQSYFETLISYCFPSSLSSSSTYFGNEKDSTTYNSILTMTAHSGMRWESFSFGGLTEIHSFAGSKTTHEISYYDHYHTFDEEVPSFRLIMFGPELAYEKNRFSLKAAYKMTLNNTEYGSGYLGDIMDHGTGQSSFGTTVSMNF